MAKDSKKAKYEISNNIRTLRFQHGEMTQKELADKVGITRQTIVAIEKMKYFPSLEVAFCIAYVFNLPLDEVFVFEPSDDFIKELTAS